MIKPVGNHILIKLEEKQTKSNLVLLDSTKEKMELRAIVQDMGDRCEYNLQPGHEVILRGSAASVCIDQENRLFVVSEGSVIAIMNYGEVDAQPTTNKEAQETKNNEISLER